MSTVEKLLEEFCPRGVSSVAVSKILKKISITKALPKNLYKETGTFPIINQAQELIAGYSDEESFVVVKDKYIVFGDHTRTLKWIDFDFIPGESGTLVFKAADGLNPKFVFYTLLNLHIESRGYNRHWTVLKELKVQIPAIEIQNEIVKILDTFTELEAELEAEFTARSKQYAFYSKSLINDSSNGDPLMLEVFCEYRKERLVNSLNPMPYIGVEDLRQDKKGISNSWQSKFVKSAPLFKTKDILLGNIRPYLKKVWFAEFDGITNGDVLIFKIKDDFVEKVLPEFLYFVLSSDDFFEYNVQYSKGAKMPRGDKDAILKYVTSLPDIQSQMNIVKILNSFKDLLTDANFGIPAEITARRKQYEYYRDKLLTFKELESA